jgi:hypothetical protein
MEKGCATYCVGYSLAFGIAGEDGWLAPGCGRVGGQDCLEFDGHFGGCAGNSRASIN